MIEQCVKTKLALNCAQSSSNNSNFIGFYVSIEVVATLIFALFISLNGFKYFRHKTIQSILNNTTNQTDQDFALYEIATESPSTRQTNNGIERSETAKSNVFFSKRRNAAKCVRHYATKKIQNYTHE